MESEIMCADAKVNKLQFDQIKESQKEIIETQNEHNTRLKILEENKIEMKLEFGNLKQNQSEQKVLMLELDRTSKENNAKQFDKILLAQTKNEDKNDTLFLGQTKILEQIVTNQSEEKKNKFELTKTKLGIIVSIIVIIEILVQKYV
ncbi:hypothetical protein [Clostridium estertheticum]|uniref:hypothetical protein n=1 Tax=Clostridium estertheticum TaxID=238834 RepID=UPI001C7D4C5D|nr:hypothetical protein [Clostridium estertheticum]MBX4266522.1 hypothetical protein [Clostridium estertheticum]WLC88137.1 hypothetical protein KTC95_19285 [Clostridium estertheticum]